MKAHTVPITADGESAANLVCFCGMMVFTGIGQHAWKIAWATEKSVVFLGDYCILPNPAGMPYVAEIRRWAKKHWNTLKNLSNSNAKSGDTIFFTQPFALPDSAPLVAHKPQHDAPLCPYRAHK